MRKTLGATVRDAMKGDADELIPALVSSIVPSGIMNRAYVIESIGGVPFIESYIDESLRYVASLSHNVKLELS